VTFQRGDHRSVLKALVDSGELTVEAGKRNAKLYTIAQVAQIAQASPEPAHGLGGGPSPARPIEDGLGTTNSGPLDTQPESGLGQPSPCPVCGKPSDDRAADNPECADNHGICPACGEYFVDPGPPECVDNHDE
jgi:hypothetical protein